MDYSQKASHVPSAQSQRRPQDNVNVTLTPVHTRELPAPWPNILMIICSYSRARRVDANPSTFRAVPVPNHVASSLIVDLTSQSPKLGAQGYTPAGKGRSFQPRFILLCAIPQCMAQTTRIPTDRAEVRVRVLEAGQNLRVLGGPDRSTASWTEEINRAANSVARILRLGQD